MEYIKLVEEKHHVSVHLNRPDIRNAFNPVMISELTDVFTKLAESKDIRVVSLQGEGKSFCSGADLNWMKSMANFTLDENLKDSEKLHDMFQALHDCPIPLVVRVHGHVMGGALGLVGCADIVVAETHTKFCFSETRLGLAPAVISPFVMQKIGFSQSSRFLMGAELFTSDQAKTMGLVHEVANESDLVAVHSKIVEHLKSLGPVAVRKTKKLVRELHGNLVTKTKSKTTKLIADLRVGEEGQQGLSAFLNKSEPSWKS